MKPSLPSRRCSGAPSPTTVEPSQSSSIGDCVENIESGSEVGRLHRGEKARKKRAALLWKVKQANAWAPTSSHRSVCAAQRTQLLVRLAQCDEERLLLHKVAPLRRHRLAPVGAVDVLFHRVAQLLRHLARLAQQLH